MGFFFALGLVQVFASDPRLATPITMRAKIESLSDFTADLTKLTKVHFSAATAIADRKITAIFKDRPAKEVMQAVRDGMFMDWKKDGNGYLLVMSRDDQRDEEAALRADQEAIRNGLIAGFKSYLEASGMAQADKDQKRKDLTARITALRGNPEAVDQMAELQQERSVLADSNGQALATLFSANIDGVVDSLMEGHSVCASTRPEDGCPVLPPDFLEKYNAGTGQGPRSQTPATAVLMMLNYNPRSSSLSAESIASTGEERGGQTMSFAMSYRPSLSDSGADKTKLGQKLKDWPNHAEASVMSKEIEGLPPTPAADAPPRPGPQRSRLTLADHLEFLADHAGIPVIGDAFRSYTVSGIGPEKTVKEYLAHLRIPPSSGPSLGQASLAYATAKGGWLLVKHERYWQRQFREIPESAIKPMEQSTKLNGIPTITEYAKFAASLTDAQAGSLITNPSGLAAEFDAFPFQPAYNSLRLIGSLSDQQVSAVQQGGLSLSTLSAEQKRLLNNGMSASMWRGGVPASLWAATISPRGIDWDGAVMKCRMMNYPQGEDGAPLPQKDLVQEQAWFSYQLKPGQQFSEMFIASKNFHRF